MVCLWTDIFWTVVFGLLLSPHVLVIILRKPVDGIVAVHIAVVIIAIITFAMAARMRIMQYRAKREMDQERRIRATLNIYEMC